MSVKNLRYHTGNLLRDPWCHKTHSWREAISGTPCKRGRHRPPAHPLLSIVWIEWVTPHEGSINPCLQQTLVTTPSSSKQLLDTKVPTRTALAYSNAFAHISSTTRLGGVPLQPCVWCVEQHGSLPEASGKSPAHLKWTRGMLTLRPSGTPNFSSFPISLGATTFRITRYANIKKKIVVLRCILL